MPTPRPIQPAGWSAPATAITSTACDALDLLVDTRGARHLLAECDGLIHYAASNGAGGWSEVVFGRAGGVVDRHPLLALDGDRLYAAYSQAVVQGGCGGESFTQVGVYVRSRLLPNGAWSAAMRIGAPGDQVESFAVHGGVLDLAVVTLDSVSYLETLAGGTISRYRFSGDSPSVAVAPNGRLGLAYVAGTSLRYATLIGSVLTAEPAVSLPSDQGVVADPKLAYDARGYAHLGFEFTSGPGCAHGESPLDGTYYATNAAGVWIDRRVSAALGDSSMALDPATGAADLLVDGSSSGEPWGSLSLYSSVDGRAWTRTALVSQTVLFSAVAVDPTTGRAVVAFREPSDAVTDLIGVMVQH